jgi:hypothetical protein
MSNGVESLYVRNPAVTEMTLDDDVFLVEPGTGEVFYLNAITRGLWALFAEPNSIPDEPAEKIATDVRAAAEDMHARDLIVTLSLIRGLAFAQCGACCLRHPVGQEAEDGSLTDFEVGRNLHARDHRLVGRVGAHMGTVGLDQDNIVEDITLVAGVFGGVGGDLGDGTFERAEFHKVIGVDPDLGLLAEFDEPDIVIRHNVSVGPDSTPIQADFLFHRES